jgi:hypothetical protein
MKIDNIEKLNKFPSFLNYYLISLKEINYMFIFVILMFLFSFKFYACLILVYIFIIPFFEYHIDKNIYKSFKIRRKRSVNDNQ